MNLINKLNIPFFECGSEAKKGQATKDDFLHSLPFFIFFIQFFPTLPSFRRVLSALPKNAENNILDFAGLNR